jgi:hypothetical protein
MNVTIVIVAQAATSVELGSGGWLAPGRLRHINAGALKICANGIGMLKIYFLEYRMSTIDPQAKNHVPSKAPQRSRGFSKVHRIKSYLKNNVKPK